MKLTTIILLVLLPMTTPAQTPRDSIPTDSLGTHELAEITVTSQRPLVRQEVDKLTYDVAHDKDAKASNVLDMLKKVPMVSVDGNDEIRVNGDSSFKIYKNGHPNPAFNGQGAKDILRNMPASSIKRIEVITDPGAKYDAEGTTMILNIVTEEGASLVGLSGYAGLQANTLGYTAPYFGITAKKGKWTTDNYLTYIYQPDKMNSYTDVYDYDFPSIGQKRHESIREDHHINALYDVLSASYEADSLNFLSLEGNLFYYEIGGFKMSHDYANTLYDGDILSRYTALNRLPKHRYMDASVRADFEHKTHRDGEALTLSYMLTTVRSRRDMASEFSRPDSTHRPAWEYDGYLSTRQELFLENTFQTDYIRPLWKGHKMEVGAKYINRTNRSKSGQDYFGTAALPDSTRSHFKHLTQVAAAYMEYIYNGRRWSARAGLRYEYSHLEARFPDGSQPEFHTNLGDWCPSASLMYKFAETYTLKLCYGTNINRPGIGYLNPMRFTTPTGGSYGNPNLESNKQHQLTLTFAHTGTKTSYQLTPSFSLSNDMIGVSMSADGNQTWTTYGNVIRSRIANLSGNLQWQATPTTKLSLSGGGYYRHFDNPSLPLAFGGWGGWVYTNLSQSLPKECNLSIYFRTQFGQRPYSVYATDGNYVNYRISLQKRFLKDKFTARLSWNNPFMHHSVYGNRVVQGDYTMRERLYRESQSLAISLSWSFGKLKAQVRKTDTSIKNNDVVGGMQK